MTWACKDCGISNEDHQATCNNCGAPGVGPLVLTFDYGNLKIKPADGSFIFGSLNYGGGNPGVDMSRRQMRFYVSQGKWKLVNLSQRVPIEANRSQLKTLEYFYLEEGVDCTIECGGLTFTARVESE